MNTHSNRYEDVVFFTRNQAYGSYELRVHYHRRALKALLLGITLFAALVLFHAAGSKEDPPISFTSAASHRTHDLVAVILAKPPSGASTTVEPKPAKHALRSTLTNTPPVVVPDQAAKDPNPTKDITQPGMDRSPSEGSGTNPVAGAGLGGSDSAGNADVTLKVKPPAGPIKIAEVMPAFRGNLEQWLARNLRYPESARLAGEQGRVMVQFVVEAGGNITAVQVVRSVSAALDTEAVRVVKAMPPWKPGMQNGQPVRVLFAIPITFVLE